MLDSITNPERKKKFNEILKLLEQIDSFVGEKGKQEGGERFELVTVGNEMMRLNSKFYQSGVKLGDEAFSTLATESKNKRDLAMSFLAVIYTNWTYDKKTNFDVLEIGAGSGDLMKEIFAIRDEVMASESSSDKHKAFFKSLKFNIVDFPQMIAIQKERLGENAKEVNFIEHDISKNLLPNASFDFIYGNEIPDTQRVDFLEIKTKNGEKEYYLRALKTKESGEVKEIVVNLKNSPDIVKKIEENLFPIAGLGVGVYKLQFGFHALMHNTRQSLKHPGFVLFTDYYDFDQNFSRRDLSFAGADGANLSDHKKLTAIGEPGAQLIIARGDYRGMVDVTYTPNVGSDTCKLFDIITTALGEDDRSKAILNLRIRERDLETLQSDKIFGSYIKTLICNLSENQAMPNELVNSRSLKQIIGDEGISVRLGYSVSSPSGAKADAKTGAKADAPPGLQ